MPFFDKKHMPEDVDLDENTVDAEAAEPEIDIERENANLLDALLSADDEVFKEVPMPRFGENAYFKVRGISSELYAKLERQCKYPVKNKRTGKREEIVDQDKLSYLLIKAACVTPDWSDPKLLQKYNTADPVMVIRKRLLLGEVTTLTQAIMDVSGFSDEIEEIKN